MRQVSGWVLWLVVAAVASAGDPGQQPAKESPKTPEMKFPDKVAGKDLDSWIKSLSDNDPSMVQTAMQALVQFGPAARKAIPELLRFLDTKRDLGVRLGAVTTIGTLGVEEQQLAEVLKGLNELLDDPQSVVRLQVVQVLATFGPLAKSAIPKLVGRQLLGDVTSWEMRQAVVATLGQVGLPEKESAGPDRQAVLALAGALRDPALPVRGAATLALINLGPPKASTDLNEVRRLLADRLAAERDLSTWLWTKLCQIRMDQSLLTDQTLATIAKQLESKDGQARVTAARILGMLGPEAKSRVPDLTRALKHDDLNTVAEATLALGRIGPDAKEAVAALEGLTKHKEEWLQQAAKMALEQIKAVPKKER
jgi:HEAT repeat protein